MRQITEDYVSLEIAKLLKDKGFNESVYSFYNQNGFLDIVSCRTRNSYTCDYAAPTNQMALKWLREVHKIYIYIKPLEDGNCFSSHLLYNGIDKLIEGGAWGSYESACEAALLYVLKNLI